MANISEIAKRIRRRLPHTTQRLVDALGWEGALAFLQRHGCNSGSRCIYIPQKYSAINGIFLGMDSSSAECLIREFGGQDIKITGPGKMLASERYELVAGDYLKRDFTVKMLIDKYKLPQQTISWIIRDLTE